MAAAYLRVRFGFAVISLVFAGHAAAQAISLSIITPPTVSRSSASAIDFLVARASEVRDTPIALRRSPAATSQAFCAGLRDRRGGLYVGTLALYASCLSDATALRAFDFPYLSRDWRGGRALLMGPLGAAIEEALTARNQALLAFWDGETRIFSSNRAFAPSDRLFGRSVVTAVPPGFATGTAIQASGANTILMSADTVAAALQAGLSDTAESTLSFFADNLTGVQRHVLLSNHSMNPVAVTMPANTLSELDSRLRGLLETLIRQATAVQVADNTRRYQSDIERIRAAGITVNLWSEQYTANFQAPTVPTATQNARNTVFTGSSSDIRNPSVSQLEGVPQTPYWKTYFVTNRARQNQQLGDAIGADVLFGHADVELDFQYATAPPGGHSSISYRRKGRGVVIDWNSVSSKPFPPELSRVPPSMPARAPVVYVHGFANKTDDALRRAAWIGWNARRPVVAFVWPSLGSALPPSNYHADQQTADVSMKTLASFLGSFGRTDAAGTDLDIIVHSMGARLLLGALTQLEGLGAQARPKFRQVVLVAPDVASKALQTDWHKLRTFFARAATLYVSDHDAALGISRSHMNPQEGDRAGLAPPVLVAEQVESIFIGPNDFSFTGHSYHVANGVIADDIMEVLRYGVGAADRRGVGLAEDGKYFNLQRLRDP